MLNNNIVGAKLIAVHCICTYATSAKTTLKYSIQHMRFAIYLSFSNNIFNSIDILTRLLLRRIQGSSNVFVDNFLIYNPLPLFIVPISVRTVNMLELFGILIILYIQLDLSQFWRSLFCLHYDIATLETWFVWSYHGYV